jgi:hypothetical protein
VIRAHGWRHRTTASPSSTAVGDGFPMGARAVGWGSHPTGREDARRTRWCQTRSGHLRHGGTATKPVAERRELDGKEQQGKWAFPSRRSYGVKRIRLQGLSAHVGGTRSALGRRHSRCCTAATSRRSGMVGNGAWCLLFSTWASGHFKTAMSHTAQVG